MFRGGYIYFIYFHLFIHGKKSSGVRVRHVWLIFVSIWSEKYPLRYERQPAKIWSFWVSFKWPLSVLLNYGAWKCTDESTLGKESVTPLMNHDPSDVVSLIQFRIIPKKRPHNAIEPLSWSNFLHLMTKSGMLILTMTTILHCLPDWKNEVKTSAAWLYVSVAACDIMRFLFLWCTLVAR